MTDVRQQLTEALDEVERLAGAVTDDHWREDVAESGHWNEFGEDVSAFLRRWDPATVLRLVEHGRKVMLRHAPMDNGSCEYCWGEVTWPCPDVLDLAAFWLGTPEADR